MIPLDFNFHMQADSTAAALTHPMIAAASNAHASAPEWDWLTTATICLTVVVIALIIARTIRLSNRKTSQDNIAAKEGASSESAESKETYARNRHNEKIAQIEKQGKINAELLEKETEQLNLLIGKIEEFAANGMTVNVKWRSNNTTVEISTPAKTAGIEHGAHEDHSK